MSKINNHDFGYKVGVLRREQGMSQADVSVQVGFKNKASIGKIENGNQDVSLEVAYKYANVLHVSLPELLKFEDDPFEEYIPFLKAAPKEVIVCVRKLLNMKCKDF